MIDLYMVQCIMDDSFTHADYHRHLKRSRKLTEIMSEERWRTINFTKDPQKFSTVDVCAYNSAGKSEYEIWFDYDNRRFDAVFEVTPEWIAIEKVRLYKGQLTEELAASIIIGAIHKLSLQISKHIKKDHNHMRPWHIPDHMIIGDERRQTGNIFDPSTGNCFMVDIDLKASMIIVKCKFFLFSTPNLA